MIAITTALSYQTSRHGTVKNVLIPNVEFARQSHPRNVTNASEQTGILQTAAALKDSETNSCQVTLLLMTANHVWNINARIVTLLLLYVKYAMDNIVWQTALARLRDTMTTLFYQIRVLMIAFSVQNKRVASAQQSPHNTATHATGPSDTRSTVRVSTDTLRTLYSLLRTVAHMTVFAAI